MYARAGHEAAVPVAVWFPSFQNTRFHTLAIGSALHRAIHARQIARLALKGLIFGAAWASGVARRCKDGDSLKRNKQVNQG